MVAEEGYLFSVLIITLIFLGVALLIVFIYWLYTLIRNKARSDFKKIAKGLKKPGR